MYGPARELGGNGEVGKYPGNIKKIIKCCIGNSFCGLDCHMKELGLLFISKWKPMYVERVSEIFMEEEAGNITA